MSRKGSVALRKRVPLMLRCMLLIVLLSACNRQPDPIHVSGTVTYQGKPVPRGFILIHADRKKGNSGLYGIANIRDGKFDTNEEGGRPAMPGPVNFAVAGYGQGQLEDFSDSVPLFPSYQVEKEIKPDVTTFEIAIP